MQDAQPVLVQEAPAAHEPLPALPLRDHTILGVCEALGEDFGFNPLFLRIPLATLVLWNFVAAIGIYLALGVAVALSRLIFPAARPAAVPQLAPAPAVPAAANQANSDGERLAA